MGISEALKDPTAPSEVTVNGSSHVNRGIYQTIKRPLDAVGAIIGITIMIPLFTIIAILIKLEDPKGNIFFSQTRVGKNGREFQMYKFRSMVTDAEKQITKLSKHNEIEGHMFKMKNDPRVTCIGRVIRKMSLDELPQLWNVVKGDMSLVGPRPPLPCEVKNYTAYHRQRLQVTPGCTGLWQVSGRNRLNFEQMVELDLRYIRRQSFKLDAIIMLKTVKEIFASNDAY
ncbi:sugar transferase [Gorillibacterium timonense]|uniref:sugar transferase n=1 Tax=Gorillibacterium timonense TaxID=1689269 RepID=UPI00071DC691|nr:sugar transferase [Gorillibacterium timonense]